MEKTKYCWNCGEKVPYQEYKNIDFIPTCSKCGVKYPEKPKDEALLSVYQDEYLKDRNERNYNRFFELLNKVTFNIICHKLKSSSAYESIDDILDKTQWTMEKLTKYYTEKPDFKITTSFVQYLGQVVLYPLYNKDEKERQDKEISLHSPKYKDNKGNVSKELADYLSSNSDGGINKCDEEMDYVNNKNHLLEESVSFISSVIESLYNYENNKHTNDAFKNAYYIALLYKYFINGQISDKIVEDIMNSMDYSLIEKFDKSREIYKDILMKYACGEAS